MRVINENPKPLPVSASKRKDEKGVLFSSENQEKDEKLTRE